METETETVAQDDFLSYEVRLHYVQQGRLMELLNKTPRSKWTEKDNGNRTIIFHLFNMKNDNIEALITLLQSRLFDFNTAIFSYGTWTALGYTIGTQQYKYVEILCAMGYLHVSIERSNALFCSPTYNDVPISRFLISCGWRLYSYSFEPSLFCFQEGVVKCRDVIVTLLGLKKRRLHTPNGNSYCTYILPKLDRLLIQQELAVAIWSTRHQVQADKSSSDT